MTTDFWLGMTTLPVATGLVALALITVSRIPTEIFGKCRRGHRIELILDPDDPIVRLVRQAQAMGDGRIHQYLGETTMTCPTCLQCTQRPVYAHSIAVTHDYAIPIATYCPNCPPEGDDE